MCVRLFFCELLTNFDYWHVIGFNIILHGLLMYVYNFNNSRHSVYRGTTLVLFASD